MDSHNEIKRILVEYFEIKLFEIVQKYDIIHFCLFIGLKLLLFVINFILACRQAADKQATQVNICLRGPLLYIFLLILSIIQSPSGFHCIYVVELDLKKIQILEFILSQKTDV